MCMMSAISWNSSSATKRSTRISRSIGSHTQASDQVRPALQVWASFLPTLPQVDPDSTRPSTTLTPFLPVLRDAFIVGDAVQPGLKFRFTFKIFQPVQHFKHHLLTDIVSIAIVPQISCTHVKKRSLVTAHQFFIGPRHIEKLDVGPRDQLLIRELAGIVTRQKRLRFIQNKSCRQSVQCPPRPVSATWRHRLAG